MPAVDVRLSRLFGLSSGFGNQPARTFVQRVCGVERTSRRAELEQCVLHCGRRFRERPQVKHPAESIGTGVDVVYFSKGAALLRPRGGRADDRSCGTGADACQKSPACDFLRGGRVLLHAHLQTGLT
jgi:hypothetical protein